MAGKTKVVRQTRLEGTVGPGDAIWVASPDEQTGKAAHLVSWQGQMADGERQGGRLRRPV